MKAIFIASIITICSVLVFHSYSKSVNNDKLEYKAKYANPSLIVNTLDDHSLLSQEIINELNKPLKFEINKFYNNLDNQYVKLYYKNLIQQLYNQRIEQIVKDYGLRTDYYNLLVTNKPQTIQKTLSPPIILFAMGCFVLIVLIMHGITSINKPNYTVLNTINNDPAPVDDLTTYEKEMIRAGEKRIRQESNDRAAAMAQHNHNRMKDEISSQHQQDFMREASWDLLNKKD